MQTIKTILAIIGSIYALYFMIGLYLDISTFDQTEGGYIAPYQGWTGMPVDWDSFDETNLGLVKNGYVMDVHIHGTTGMISFVVMGQKFDWQTPSERALKVHQPREALIRRGFKPEF